MLHSKLNLHHSAFSIMYVLLRKDLVLLKSYKDVLTHGVVFERLPV